MILRAAKYSVLIIVFLCVTGVSAYLTLTYLIKSENRVIVPDLEGRDVVYALEILTDLGLNIKVKGSEYSSDITKNHVIVQEPGPGERDTTSGCYSVHPLTCRSYIRAGRYKTL